MPDSKNRRDMELAKYEAMSTEELQALLREDASKPEGEESDEGVLFCVMEVLAKRRQARNEGKSPEEALESFVKNYMPEDEDTPGTERVSTARSFKPNARRWMSGLVAAAAMIVLVFGMSLTANAFGFDVWEIIVQWTQETFHFAYSANHDKNLEPNGTTNEEFAELQAAIDDYDISVSLVPTWLPDGYEEAEVEVLDTPKRRQFAAKYQCADKIIMIRIADYFDAAPSQIEQSGSLLDTYTSSGVEYYIFENNGMLQAAWINDNFECYISGPLSLEEIRQMIDSIEKG